MNDMNLALLILLQCLYLNYSVVADATFKDDSVIKIIDYNKTFPDEENIWDIVKVDTIFPTELSLLAGAIDSLPNEGCQQHARRFIEGILRRDLWAMQMIDASPKFPVGMRYGETYQMGNFDECTSIRHHETNKKNASIEINGKYCMAEIFALTESSNGTIREVFRGTFGNSLHWGICVPSSCSPNDVSTFFNELFDLLFHNGHKVNVSVSSLSCNTEEKLQFSTMELTYGSVLIAYACIILGATSYHLISLYKNERHSTYTLESPSKKGGTFHRVIIAFSLARNISKIMQVKRKNEINLDCVSGVKALFMGLIIPGHTLLFAISGPIMNSEFYEQARLKVQNAIFFNNPLLVDTFLFLSGFLMCRILIEELDKRKGKINILFIYIGRYFRLTPSYLVVIGFYCTFFSRIDNGPLWNSVVMKEKERCINSWWANILYINNYLFTDNLCMFQSWFLAVDTHMFIIAAVLIVLLWKYKNLGKIVLGVVTVGTIIAHGVETYLRKVDPTLMIFPSEVVDLNSNSYFTNIYIKTHIRASSYCIGLISGYIVYKLHKSGTKIPSYVQWSGWLLAILTGVASMFSIAIFYQPGHQYDVTESSMYSAFHSLAWCGFVGWVLTMCITGNGGVLNTFLSWKLFTPLSRLTYCAYLVNGIVELHSRGTLRHPVYMSVFNLTKISISHLTITFIGGFFLCALFESPIHSLEKILLESEKNRRANSRTGNNNQT